MAKVLIVDDDAVMSRMYQTKFSLDGYQVEIAGDGEEALKKVTVFKPDMILLDVMMPKKNGLDTLKDLKADKNTKSIPVVMLTNVSSSDSDGQQALELGAVTYLVKANYTPREVVQKVKEILGATTHELPQVKTVVRK